jgi:four helix bundle protein
MPPPSSYKKLEAYNLAKRLVVDCYELTHDFSPEEKTNLAKYIRTAAVTVFLNIAQGIFLKKRKKRKKFINSAKNALVIIEAALEVLVEVKMIQQEQTKNILESSSILYQVMDRLQSKE